VPFLSGLVSRFRRDGGQLQPPTAMADGVCHGPAGTWAWVVIPPRSTDELPSGALAMATADAGSDLRRLVPPGADFHFKVQWARWSGAAYLDAELREDMNAGAAEFTKLQADRIEDTAVPAPPCAVRGADGRRRRVTRGGGRGPSAEGRRHRHRG